VEQHRTHQSKLKGQLGNASLTSNSATALTDENEPDSDSDSDSEAVSENNEMCDTSDSVVGDKDI
jgi:hypothetical protein